MNRLFLPALYFVVSIIYCFMGLSVLSRGVKKREYVLFFFACMSLVLWSVCFGMSFYVVSLDDALKYRQLASIGWSMFYPLTFLFILNVKKSNLAKNKLATFLILLCGVVCLGLHTFMGDFSKSQFSLVYTKFGWVNKSDITVGYVYFYAMLAVFLVSSLISLIRWMKDVKRTDKERYNQLKCVFISFGIATFLYAMTEFRINLTTDGFFPQITIIYLLIPVTVVYFMIMKRKFITETVYDYKSPIISQESRRKIFNVVGYIYVFYGFTLLGIYFYINQGDVFAQFLFFVTLIVLGSLHFVIPAISNNPKIDYGFFTLSAILSMVVLNYKYMDYSGVTVWTMLIMFVIATAMFENKSYSLIITSSMILANIFFWAFHGKNLAHVKITDYIIRVMTIVLTYLITNYTNYVFRQKFDENEEHIVSQKILTSISSDLININSDNQNSIIDSMIKTIVKHFEFKVGIVYKYDDSTDFLKAENWWYLKNDDARADGLQGKIALKNFTWSMSKLLNNQPVTILDTKNLPTEALEEKDFYTNCKVVGFIAYPIYVDDEFYGVMMFEFLQPPPEKFTHDNFFSMVATLLGNAKKKLKSEDELYQNANYDKVTGLGNRRNFNSNLDTTLKNLSNKDNLALLHIDVYKFSTINEAFGYDIGDEVLKEIGSILVNHSFPNSKCFRFGADEFMIYTVNYGTRQGLIKELDRLWSIFQSPVKVKNYEFRVSLNMGIALFPQDGTTAQELSKNAALALTESVKSNRHSYSFCKESSKVQTAENLRYTNKLYTALSNGEFALAMQPQIDSTTGKTVGAEVLLRWMDRTENRMISPYKFVPLLEETGLIIEVGEWIISEALAIQERLAKKGFDYLSFGINLSAIQFLDENLVSMIEKNISKSNVNPNKIELEITESSAIQEQHTMIEKFNKLKDLGCNIAIDDFGMEFSSLNRIQALPIDKIKIDKTFIDGIKIDPKKEAIIEIIINLSKILGVKCIAEGVEHKYQVDFLKEKGCNLVQGYYYSKPLLEKEFENYLTTVRFF